MQQLRNVAAVLILLHRTEYQGRSVGHRSCHKNVVLLKYYVDGGYTIRRKCV
jgi:hypothetical protein